MAINIPKTSDMDLANLIYATEGIDISNKEVSDDIKQLIGNRDKAIEEIKKRTGISDNDGIRQYVQTKLKEQDEMRGRQWEELYQEGAVFKLKNSDYVFETIRTYLPTTGMSGPKQYIFARLRGKPQFNRFDDRDVSKLEKVEDKPTYTECTPEERGVIRFDEETEVRERGEPARCLEDWKGLDDHTVFYHAGFDETFEAIDKYNIPGKEQNRENEVILARSHTRPLFVEFTLEDILLMRTTPHVPQKFRKGVVYDLDN